MESHFVPDIREGLAHTQVPIAILGVLVMAFKTRSVRLSVKKNHSVKSLGIE